jgi:phage N-6-adenine-methyltransferase
MTISTVLYSSTSHEWSTPRGLFAQLHRLYRFTLDPCATPDNATCPLYFTKKQDGLKQHWGRHRVFCNPPYGRGVTEAWVRKCFEASQAGALVVLLVPARTDTKWFHDWVEGKAKVQFLPGRMRFGNARNSAPFPSMLAVYSSGRVLVTCARCGAPFIAKRDPRARACSNACRQWLCRTRNRYGLNLSLYVGQPIDAHWYHSILPREQDWQY